MRPFRGDLHIHSCLSPCADLEMSPKAIVEQSMLKGLDVIALCDHNSAENVGAAIRAASGTGLALLPGMEINSMEEVHVLSIFDDEMQAKIMQDIIYKNLRGTNRPDIFGDQLIVNEFDEVEGISDKMLIGATDLRVDEIVKETHRLGGLSIASHIDRPSYSIISQLGFIPPDLELDAVELSPLASREDFSDQIPAHGNLPIVRSSDAHFQRDIGKVHTSFIVEYPNVDEIRMALKQNSGRRVVN
ncbi:MAG: PHP domain-containing protein [Deltaproteobacteria bacterium]|nr:PHP domain-containing protein [Deltaproteobacteria bacterium]